MPKTVNLEDAGSNPVAYPKHGVSMKSAKNDVTGDSIRTKASNHNAYGDGWERIFGKKKDKTKKVKNTRKRFTKDN